MEKNSALSKHESGVTEGFVAPGLHLLIDFWGCANMQDEEGIGRTLRDAAAACGATVLDVHLHTFGEKGGVTGVATLAESHISIHTWPEIDYVALDVFVCGACRPWAALEVLEDFFRPARREIGAHERGIAKKAEERAITA